MDLNKAYGMNKDAVDNGKWFTTDANVKVKVAKIGNPFFVAELQRLQKNNITVLRSGTPEAGELNAAITLEAIAKTILKDWEVEIDGVSIPYTWEVGVEYMTKYYELHEHVSAFALDRNNFRPEDIAGK